MTEDELENNTVVRPSAERDRGASGAILEKTWDYGRGFFAWLKSTDHKSVGIRTVVTAFIFFASPGFSHC